MGKFSLYWGLCVCSMNTHWNIFWVSIISAHYRKCVNINFSAYMVLLSMIIFCFVSCSFRSAQNYHHYMTSFTFTFNRTYYGSLVSWWNVLFTQHSEKCHRLSIRLQLNESHEKYRRNGDIIIKRLLIVITLKIKASKITTKKTSVHLFCFPIIIKKSCKYLYSIKLRS